MALRHISFYIDRVVNEYELHREESPGSPTSQSSTMGRDTKTRPVPGGISKEAGEGVWESRVNKGG